MKNEKTENEKMDVDKLAMILVFILGITIIVGGVVVGVTKELHTAAQCK